jgi:hypothetical protein
VTEKDALVESIYEQLGDLKDVWPTPAALEEIRRRLQVTAEVITETEMQDAVTSCTDIKAAARSTLSELRKVRARMRENGLADLLRRVSPVQLDALEAAFQAPEKQLEWLLSIEGPDPRFEIVKWLAAKTAHSLIVDFSVEPPTTTEKGPLRTITSQVYEYFTGEKGCDLKRACDAVMRDE